MRPKQFYCPDFLKDLGNLIYLKRGGRCGDSIRDAAKQAGVSAATLSRVERGGVPDIESFRKICLWLNLSADVLLKLPVQPPQENRGTE